jgi:hypothetical protein
LAQTGALLTHFNDALLLHVLGPGAPTHQLAKSSYAARASTYRWESACGMVLEVVPGHCSSTRRAGANRRSASLCKSSSVQVKEKIMSFFSKSWIWIVILAAVLVMHMFAHGGHGWHDGHVEANRESKPVGNANAPNPPVTAPGGPATPLEKNTGK